MLNRTLAHYRITKKLGAGGMGEVWRATDLKLDRDVALKVLPADVASDPVRLERFRREAKAVAALNHPHIVTLYSVEEADGQQFLTMELVDGRGLDALLDSGGLSLDTTLEIGNAVADALAAAHGRGIVHRDLKPANVMLTRDGRVKVLDFGLAKSVDAAEDAGDATRVDDVTRPADLTGRGTVVGTVPYMSPEQIRGRPVGPASDLFSLGILLYEMATGSNPFRAGSPAETMSAILRDEPARLDEAVDGAPPELASVIRDCLAKEPAARPASASAVATRLERCRRDPSSGADTRTSVVEAAPAAAARARRSNLPEYVTTFVGRQSSRERLTEILKESRLAVLTGVGGTGKTRLAVETAAALSDDLADGAWLAELAPVTDPALVIPTIGDVWGLRPGEGARVEDVLVNYLWSKDALLIVDNCEHLLQAASEAVRLLLDRCPRLRIIATSRESLGIPGETILRVPSLSLPESGADVPGTEAGMLFLDRARAADGSFDPDAEDLEAIARIARRIDGIPLGLELAAARLRSMEPIELAHRLEESFRILSGSAKTALPRQRTLQATIDWSHDLLDEPGRILFRRLAVFAGGFHLDAVEAVCAGDGLEPHEIVDHLDALVDQSLVVVVPGKRKRTRYRLLEPVRQYAQERLGPSGEAAAVRAAHARRFAALAESAAPKTRGPDQMPWERRIETDYENFRAAFATLLADGEITAYLRLGFHLFGFWAHTGLQTEAIETLIRGLRAAGDETDAGTLVRAWFIAAILGAEITSVEAIGHAREGLAVAEADGDPSLVGMMEIALGAAINHSTTDPEYLEHLVRGRELVEAHPPGWWESPWEQGVLHLVLGAYLPKEDPRVVEHFETALRIFEEVGDEALLAATLADSVGLAGAKGIEWAIGNSRRAVEILDRIHAPYWRAHAHQTLGFILRYQEEFDLAAESFRTAVGLLSDCGDLHCWATSSRWLAQCSVRRGHPEEAARLLTEVIDAFPLLPMQEIAMPRTLDLVAEALVALGRHAEAAFVLGRASEVSFAPSTLIPREPLLDDLRTRVAEALGADAAQARSAEGKDVTNEETLERAREWLAAATAQ